MGFRSQPAIFLVAAVVLATCKAEFFCRPIYGYDTRRTPPENSGRHFYRVGARTPSDVAAMNARFGGGSRFLFFRNFIMDGTCPRPNETRIDSVYNMVDMDNTIGNGTDFRCGHHRGIGHDAGFYSIVLQYCLTKIGTVNRFANAPTPPPSSRGPTISPTSQPTVVPTVRPTLSPTLQPTNRPTNAPSQHPCNDGSHGCDTASTQCVISSVSPGFQCACRRGYAPIAGSSISCAVAPTVQPSLQPTTEQPTDFPTTMMPTMSPTMAPSQNPCVLRSHLCDTQSTTCFPYAFTPGYTCVCRLGYIPAAAVDPVAQRSCIATDSPTTMPTDSPTRMPSESPTLRPTDYQTVAPSAIPTSDPTAMPPTTSQGSASSGSSGWAGNSKNESIAIVILVAVAILGAIILERHYCRTTTEAAQEINTNVGFENPMYADSPSSRDSTDVDGGAYMDVPTNDSTGYMDVPAIEDDMGTSEAYDPSNAPDESSHATDYMDVDVNEDFDDV